ncbi:MAG: glycosyltransferase family 39 protein [Acidobacteria bacterium]|nr:glycosyltransferase family 39 protein [Acidobacteriota bacterium]
MNLSKQKKSKSGRFTPFGIIFTILGILLFAYFVKKAGLTEIWTDIKQLGAGFLLVLLVSSARPIVRCAAWTQTFQGEHRLRFRDAISAYMVGDAVGTLVPLGIFVSEPTKAALVRKRVPLVASLSALAVENIFYSLSVALFIFTGTAALLFSFNLPKPLRIVSIAALIVIVLLIPLAVLVLRKELKFLSGALEFLIRRGIARGLLERKREGVRDVEARIYGFYAQSSRRFLYIILLEACFHLAGVMEVFVTLWFISESRPSLLTAFVLESVNRSINVVFKFVPFRIGVDEAGTGKLAEVLALTTATGVSLAIVRKAHTRLIILILSAFIVFGLGLRVMNVSSVGFAEDEINKLEAVRAYERGDITPNAEHPMLMKVMIFLSMKAARAWNGLSSMKISDETALRFPNVLFGALTVLPIFLLTAAFFNRRTALMAAALWAFGINAITYNRIAKEDTLMVFFLLFAFYLYLRAKLTSGFDPQGKKRNYILSGMSFGLMLASKYFPHYFGLNSLYYYLVRVRAPEPGEPRGKTPAIFYIVMLLAFLVANPAVLLPQTLEYLNAYSSEQLLTHTGYLMGEHLYKNNMSATPFWGTPLYFYVLYLIIKVPVPVIIALVTGLIVAARRPRHPGHAFLLLMFLLWIVPYSLMGAKWLRYTLSLLPFVYMLAALGIEALISWCASWLKSAKRESFAQAASILLIAFFVAWPAWTAYAANPHYAAYTNVLGAGRAGYYFPHDEFYDDGLREAIEFVCRDAPPGAVIAGETPAVFRYYLEKFNRKDLESRVLSDPKFELATVRRPAYIIIQKGRTYFENREKMKEVEGRYGKVFDIAVRGASAAAVYKME